MTMAFWTVTGSADYRLCYMGTLSQLIYLQ